jgi:hypothetical protein
MSSPSISASGSGRCRSPGGGGTEAVVRAPADGYTLLQVGPNNAISATLYDKLFHPRYRAGREHRQRTPCYGGSSIVFGQNSSRVHCLRHRNFGTYGWRAVQDYDRRQHGRTQRRPLYPAMLHHHPLRVKATQFLRRRFLHLVAGAAALPAASRIASAQAYPARPVRIVVPSTAGGATDITARLIGQWLSERFGQQFITDQWPRGSDGPRPRQSAPLQDGSARGWRAVRNCQLECPCTGITTASPMTRSAPPA